MSDAIKRMRDFLTISPSVVYPDEVLELLGPIEAENAKLRELASELRMCSKTANCLKCEHGRFCDLRLDERCRELGIEVSNG